MAKRTHKSRQRVPRTRGMGTLTEAQWMGKIRSALRREFRFWPPITEARKRARIKRGLYRCAECGGAFPTKEVQVDHVVPVGRMDLDTLGEWVERLCEEDPALYRVLCKPCHQEITNRQREERRG